jgi:hypothetical protein
LKNATSALKERGDAVINEKTRPDVVKHEKADDIDNLTWTTSLDE